MRTLFPATKQRSIPPRSDACSARIESTPSFAPHKGAKAQWAEPHTGSSFTFSFGANERETQSASDPLLVIESICPGKLVTRSMLGAALRTSSSLPKTQIRSRHKYASTGRAPIASSMASVTSTGVKSNAGMSMVSHLPCVATKRRPERVSKLTPLTPGRSKWETTYPEASVACPQRSTSPPGVNQRSL